VSKVSIFWRRASMAGWDATSWMLALGAVVVVRYDFQLAQAQWLASLAYTVAGLALTIVGCYAFHLYLGRSRVGSFAEATALGFLMLVVGVVLGGIFMLVPSFARGVALVLPVLALTFMGFGRWAFRNMFRRHRRRPAPDEAVSPPAALVYGAGDAGHDVARLIDTSTPAPYRLVGFIDDDPNKKYRRIRSYRVLGRGSDLGAVVRDHDVRVVILAIGTASRRLTDRLAEECREAGVKLLTVPPVRERIGMPVRLHDLREFNVADLLGRRPIHTDVAEIAGYVKDKVVLVTGAGGSIGSELSRQVSRLGPRRLILLDRDESALHALQLSLYGVGLLNTDDMVLCDIRDQAALREALHHHRPEVVFHAAALKHLPMLEMYPLEGWKTNVVGTLNVLEAAHEVGVTTLVNISTDKAADPTNVLGRSKRCAERLTSWYSEELGLRYLSVRFGNVLGSRGSVLDTFRSQIEHGGPITVTDPEVTRYFMTIPEACELVLQAGAIGGPTDVMVLDMGEPIRILDIARRLLDEAHRGDIDITVVGLRPGEKLHEALFSAREHGQPSAHPLITRVAVPPLAPTKVRGVDPHSHEDVGRALTGQAAVVAAQPSTASAPSSPASAPSSPASTQVTSVQEVLTR